MTEYTDNLGIYFISYVISFWQLGILIFVALRTNRRNEYFFILYKILCALLSVFHIMFQLVALDPSYALNLSSVVICVLAGFLNFKIIDNYSHNKLITFNSMYLVNSLFVTSFNIYTKTDYSNDFVKKILPFFIVCSSFLPALCSSYILYVHLLHKHKNMLPMTEVSSQKVGDEDCCICLDKLNTNPCVALTCAHTYHKQCIDTHFAYSKSCPICRRNYEMVSIPV